MDSNIKEMQRVPSLQFSVFSRSEVVDTIVAAAATKSLSNSKVEHVWDSSFPWKFS